MKTIGHLHGPGIGAVEIDETDVHNNVHSVSVVLKTTFWPADGIRRAAGDSLWLPHFEASELVRLGVAGWV